MKSVNIYIPLLLLLFLAEKGLRIFTKKSDGTSGTLSDDALLDTVQRRTFNYFWDRTQQRTRARRRASTWTGYIPKTTKNVVTSGSGFGIMAVLAGIDRGYVTREEGLARMERIVSFLETADRFRRLTPDKLVWRYGAGKVLRAERQWRR